MKTKKLQKKLIIKKSTIAHLGQNTMSLARGGAKAITCSVFPCLITESCTIGDTCDSCTCYTCVYNCTESCTCPSIYSNGGNCC